VDAVRGGGAFVHQLVAVVDEHPEIRGVAGHRSDWWQGILSGSDAGDRDRVHWVGFALTGSAQPFPGPRAQVLESVAVCKGRATPASVWAVSASSRCRLVHLPLRDTHVIESERTAVGKHGADLWKPVVLRSLRHDAGHWRSHSVRASSRTI
jgi:hypothetical protein